jgi:hypothetical protein
MDVKKQQELAFNKQYSRFKLQIFYKRRSTITHYGNERVNCTFDQIRFGHIKKLMLNRELGLQDCIARIAICEKLYGKYTTAIIYDRRKKTVLEDGTEQKGREIIKYISGQLVESENPFCSESEKKIYTEVVHFSEKGESVFRLEPCDPPVDFKKEVAKALAIK